MLTLDCRREPCKQRVWGEAFQADRATSLTGVQGALCVGPAPAGPGDVVMRGCCHDLGLIGQPPLAEIPPKSGSLVLPSGSPQQTVSNRLGCECGGDPAGGLSLATPTGCQPSLFSWAGWPLSLQLRFDFKANGEEVGFLLDTYEKYALSLTDQKNFAVTKL